MVRHIGKKNGDGSEGKGKLENEIDALFRLPVAEFTSARNTLAARLKQEGRRDEAERVKLLAKPSISAWTVNQLYWEHRDAFDQLIATGKRFHVAQASRLTGKAANVRDSLDARREALIELSDLATTLLRDAGHNPSPDTIRRITTTLESISAYALLPDGPTPGRLTHDVDPPSFESLASLLSGAGTIEQSDEPTPSRKSGNRAETTRPKATTPSNVRQIEEFRQARIAAAKVALQDAKRSLADARAKVQTVEAAQKQAHAESKEAEKHRREAEQRLKQATAASEDAARRAQSVAADVEQVTKAVEDAKRTVEEATKELELLFRRSPAR